MARAARFTEQLSALIPEESKAFLLGCAQVEGVSEADVVRTLLDDAIEGVRLRLGQDALDERVEVGRAELARRADTR